MSQIDIAEIPLDHQGLLFSPSTSTGKSEKELTVLFAMVAHLLDPPLKLVKADVGLTQPFKRFFPGLKGNPWPDWACLEYDPVNKRWLDRIKLVELEVSSSGFGSTKGEREDPGRYGIVVCWEHDEPRWPHPPLVKRDVQHIRVVALKEVLARMPEDVRKNYVLWSEIDSFTGTCTLLETRLGE